MLRLVFLHVAEKETVEITEQTARMLIQSRYYPSVHAIMMSDLKSGNRISVHDGHIEARIEPEE